jgi:hypothetical protein
MKIKCINNTGKALRIHELSPLESHQIGRFGATENSEYNEIEIGREYLVMGMIVFDTYLSYLIDDGIISACPCQLFEVVDDKVNPNWHFRLVRKNEGIYPYIQAIFGYYELCYDEKSYEKLIVDKDDEATRLYFQRKIELEKEIEFKDL